jgi:hypothetical protein
MNENVSLLISGQIILILYYTTLEIHLLLLHGRDTCFSIREEDALKTLEMRK